MSRGLTLQRSQPLALQLMHELATRISSGELVGEDGRLPSEGELCQRYSVSRATVREALTKLELAGVVVRRQGVGTFVSRIVRGEAGSISGWLDEAPAFVDLIARSGQRPSVKLLSLAIRPAGRLASPLEIDPDAPVVSIEKLFMADDLPVIHSLTAIPRDLVEPGGGAALSAEGYRKPTNQVLEDRGHRKTHHHKSEVKAVLADGELAAVLRCQPGDPLLRLEEIGFDRDQTPLFHALHHFRADRVSFRQIRVPTLTIDQPWQSPNS